MEHKRKGDNLWDLDDDLGNNSSEQTLNAIISHYKEALKIQVMDEENPDKHSRSVAIDKFEMLLRISGVYRSLNDQLQARETLKENLQLIEEIGDKNNAETKKIGRDSATTLAWLYECVPNDENAKIYYENALEFIDNEFSTNYNMATFLLTKEKDYTRAIPYFQKAIEFKDKSEIDPLAPETYSFYSEIAQAYLGAKDYENAMKYLDIGLEINENDYGCNLEKVKVLLEQKKYEECLVYNQKVLDNSEGYREKIINSGVRLLLQICVRMTSWK